MGVIDGRIVGRSVGIKLGDVVVGNTVGTKLGEIVGKSVVGL